MKNLLYKEEKAIQVAAVYRDKYTKLEQRNRDLETEKEALRHFWRNELIEGHTRAARMLKLSLADNKLQQISDSHV